MLPINRTTITIGVLVILLAAIGIQTVRASRYKIKATLAENERDQAVVFATDTKKEVEVYRNKVGMVVTKSEQLELSLANVERLRDTERLQFLKQFDKLKKDLRNLEAAGSFDWLVEEDSIPMVESFVPCPDSIRVFTYRLKDQYNDIEAKVIDTPRFDIRVPINYIDYWERKWFLGRKKWYRETTSPNKLIRLEAQESFVVSKKKKR
jgi:hypothetical protein